MPSLNDDSWDESFFRTITDEEAEEQLRDPKRWSYIVRDPTGAVCCWGRGSRKACEKAAIANAEIHAIERWAAVDAEEVEPWPECKCWRGDDWRFVIWPPRKATRKFGGKTARRSGLATQDDIRQLADPPNRPYKAAGKQ